jgi:hypothetical protein
MTGRRSRCRTGPWSSRPLSPEGRSTGTGCSGWSTTVVPVSGRASGARRSTARSLCWNGGDASWLASSRRRAPLGRCAESPIEDASCSSRRGCRTWRCRRTPITRSTWGLRAAGPRHGGAELGTTAMHGSHAGEGGVSQRASRAVRGARLALPALNFERPLVTLQTEMRWVEELAGRLTLVRAETAGGASTSARTPTIERDTSRREDPRAEPRLRRSRRVPDSPTSRWPRIDRGGSAVHRV